MPHVEKLNQPVVEGVKEKKFAWYTLVKPEKLLQPVPLASTSVFVMVFVKGLSPSDSGQGVVQLFPSGGCTVGALVGLFVGTCTAREGRNPHVSVNAHPKPRVPQTDPIARVSPAC